MENNTNPYTEALVKETEKLLRDGMLTPPTNEIYYDAEFIEQKKGN